MSTVTAIKPGDIIESWCSKHGSGGEKTPHLYQNFLYCLKCYPGMAPAPAPESETPEQAFIPETERNNRNGHKKIVIHPRQIRNGEEAPLNVA